MAVEPVIRGVAAHGIGTADRQRVDADRVQRCLQEVLLRIHRHAGELQQPSAVRAWVHQIARNAITDHREALTLTELEGLTQVDAAGRLGISISGMKSRVQRGRAQLKELLVACCEIDLDRRARITSYRPRGGPCGCQDPAPDASSAAVQRACC